MKITVTFDSLEEFCANIRLNEGFEPVPETNRFEEAKAATKALAAREAPEGFKPEENPPFEEKAKEEPAQAVTEDFRIEVRKTLAGLNKKAGKNMARDLIEDLGVDTSKLSDVALEDLPKLMEAAKEALNAI